MTDYKQLFKQDKYPNYLDVLRDLQINRLPPWIFLNTDFLVSWKQDFEKAGKRDFVPFAKMINDDVIATFKINDESPKVYLFTIPITPEMDFFKEYSDFIAWLENVAKEMIDYIKEY